MLDKLDSMQSRAFDSRNMPSQSGPLCCFCIPMKWGIVLIGVYLAMDVFTLMGMLQAFQGLSIIIFASHAVSLIPVILGAYLFAKYFCNDTESSRKKLILACALMIVANCLEFAGVVLAAVLDPNIPFNFILKFLPINGLAVLVYFYFRMVCIEWHGLYSLTRPVLNQPG